MPTYVLIYDAADHRKVDRLIAPLLFKPSEVHRHDSAGRYTLRSEDVLLMRQIWKVTHQLVREHAVEEA